MSLAADVVQQNKLSLPPSWNFRRLRDLVRLINGHPFPSESFGPVGHTPLVRIRDLLAKEFDTYVSGSFPRQVTLHDGDVVVGMDGDFNVAIWRRGPAVLNQRLCLLRPREAVDMRFIAYALPSMLKIINDLTFATTVKHLASGDLLNERVLVPPLSEQRRIADFLDAETRHMDAITSSLSSLRASLSERRFVAIHELVTGREIETQRKPAGLPWATTIPQQWPTVRLGLLAKMGSGHTPSRAKPAWWENCTIPWITTGEVSQVRDDRREKITETRECISEIGLANSAAEIHPRGTVVLCRTAASAGFSAVMDRDMATSQDFVTWTCGSKLDPYYLLWCLRAMRPDLLGRLAMGSTHKTIYVPDLQMLRVPLPPLDVQRGIVERVRVSNNRIDRAMDAIDKQLELLAERRSALVTACVTGQLYNERGREGGDVSSAYQEQSIETAIKNALFDGRGRRGAR